MDITAVRDGLAAAAATVVSTPTLNCFGYVPDSITEPAFMAAEVDIDYTGAMNRGADELTITCRVLVGRADDKASQELLNSYLAGSGPTSLRAAIEGEPGVPQTLGGACDDLMVLRVQGYRFYEHQGVQYVGAELVVKVVGEG